jgi:hypothetical protein
MSTQINYITDEIIEIKTTEYAGQIQENAEELHDDDTILQFERNGEEIRMLIEIEDPDSDSSFLDRLRYIH